MSSELKMKSIKTSYDTAGIHHVSVEYGGKSFELILTTLNGQVQGSFRNGVHTSRPMYFSVPEETRQQHFMQLKVYVESQIKSPTQC